MSRSRKQGKHVAVKTRPSRRPGAGAALALAVAASLAPAQAAAAEPTTPAPDPAPAPSDTTTPTAGGLVPDQPASTPTGVPEPVGTPAAASVSDTPAPSTGTTPPASTTGNEQGEGATPPVSTVQAPDLSADTWEGKAARIDVLADRPHSAGAVITLTNPGSNDGAWAVDGGTVTFAPKPGFTGTATITYTVTDPSPSINWHGQGTLTVNVKKIPEAAVASDKNTTTQVGSPATIDVLADATARATITLLGRADTSDGTWAVDGGKVTFTPKGLFVGTATMDYKVTNALPIPAGAKVETTATLSVKVVPVPALVASDKSVTVNYGQAATVDVLGGSTRASLTLTGPTATSQGTWTLGHGTVTFTPADGFSGTATITYQLTNTPPVAAGDQATSSATISVTVNPKPADPNPGGGGGTGGGDTGGGNTGGGGTGGNTGGGTGGNTGGGGTGGGGTGGNTGGGTGGNTGGGDTGENQGDKEPVTPGDKTDTPGQAGGGSTPNPAPDKPDTTATNPSDGGQVIAAGRGSDPARALNPSSALAALSNPGSALQRGAGRAPNPLALAGLTGEDATQDPSAHPTDTPSRDTTDPSSRLRRTPTHTSTQTPSSSGAVTVASDPQEEDDGWGIWPWILTAAALGGGGAGAWLLAGKRRKDDKDDTGSTGPAAGGFSPMEALGLKQADTPPQGAPAPAETTAGPDAPTQTLPAWKALSDTATDTPPAQD